MEKKQLNLNRPLLSVRRITSTIASESDNKRKSTDNPLPYYKSELNSGPVRNAGAIPFQWEKTPGKPKDISVIEKGIGSTLSNSQNVACLDKKVIKHESEEEGIEKINSDSDDGDESFQDARDTLSRTESFITRCSMSVYDGHEAQVQPYGSFSSDEKARNFMIDRFLPAAKAIISENSQCSSKKPVLIGQGQQKQLWKIGSAEKSSPLNQNRPKSLRHKEGGIFESDDSENFPTNTTACGLFPHFCLLNPMPGVRMENKVQSNAGCNSTASPIETKKEHARPQLERGCGESLACDSIQLETSYESPIVEKILYVDSIHKTKFQTSHKGDDFKTSKIDSDIYKNLSVDSSLERSQGLDVVNEKAALEAKISQYLDSPFLVCSENPSNGTKMETANHSKKIGSESEKLGKQVSDLDQDLVLLSNPKIVECKKIDNDIVIKNSEVDIKSQPSAEWIDREHTVEDHDGKIDLESQCGMKLGYQELSDATNFFEIPLVLPTLKAPSESWLKRTLPTISTRNTSSKSKPCCKYLFKTASLCPKWETVVNSPNVQHGVVQIREELLNPIAEDEFFRVKGFIS